MKVCAGLCVLAAGLLAVAGPAAAAIREAGNGILTIRISDDPDSIGLFTVGSSTAIAPPDGQNVFFDFKNSIVNTSYVTVRDDTSGIMWVNADPARPPTTAGQAGYTVQLMNTYPSTLTAMGTNGFVTTYVLPGLTVAVEVEVVGSALADTAVRQTVRVATTSGGPRNIGVRFLWDWMVDANDAAFFRPRDADGAWTRTFTGYAAPIPFARYEVTNSDVTRDFSIYGTVAAPSLALPPDPPDTLLYAGWGNAHLSAWSFSNTGGGVDSAILYYWGDPVPVTIAPGAPAAFTQYVSTVIDALRSPRLALTYRVSNTGYVCGGDELDYTIGITNTGDATAMNITVRDSMPPPLMFLPGSLAFWAAADSLGTPAITASAYGTSLAGGWTAGMPPAATYGPPELLRWIVDRLGPGRSAEIRFSGNLAAGGVLNAPLDSAVGATELYDSRTAWGPEVRSLNARTYLTLLSNGTSGGLAAMDQDPVRYTVLVQTACQTTVFNLRVFDTVPPGATLVGVLDGGTAGGATMVLWTLPSLAPGRSAYLSYDATVSCATVFIHNSAYADTDGRLNGLPFAQARVQTNDAEVDTSCPKLLLQKIPDVAHAKRGGTVNFQIGVLNQFNMTVANVHIWDTIPAGMAFAAASPAYTLTGNMVEWTSLPDVGPKRSSAPLTLAVTITATCFPPDPNNAELSYTAAPPLPPPDIRSGDIGIELDEPKIRLTPQPDPAPVPALDPMSFTILVGNEGYEDAVDITVWETVPANTTLLGTTPAAAVTAGPPQIVTWTLTQLGGGATAYPRMNLQVTASLGQVCFSGPAGVYSDPGLCLNYTVTGDGYCVDIAQPVVDASKLLGVPVVPVGGTARFELSLTETGSDSAINVVVTDPLTLLPNIAVTGCAGPPGWTCTLAGTDLVWNGPSIGRLQTALLSFQATVLSGTLADCGGGGNNFATVSYTNRAGDPRPLVTTNQVCLRSAQPVLELVKWSNAAPAPAVGGRLRYFFSVSNTGGVPAQNITVWDSLPVGADYLACSGGTGCGFSGGPPGMAAWTLADINPGDSVTLSLTVSTSGAFSCTNYAEADYTNSVPYTLPRAFSNGVCLPVLQAHLDVSAALSRPVYSSGEPVTINLTFTNAGDGIHGICEAQKVTVLDYVDAGSAYQLSEYLKNSQGPPPTPGSFNPAGPYVQLDIGSLAPLDGGRGTITVVPPVPTCAGGPTTSTHTILVNYDNAGGVPQPTQYFYFYVPVNSAGLALTLTPSAWVVPQGGVLTYCLTYANVCADTVTNVSIWDSLPAGVTGSASVVSFAIASVPPGGSGTMCFSVTVTGGGPVLGPTAAEAAFQNLAGVAQPRMVSTPVGVQVIAPHLSLTKQGPATGDSANPFTYTLTLRNAAANSDTAFNVTITDVLPPPLRFVAATGAPAVSGSTVTWTRPSLGIGETWIVTVDARAPDAQSDYHVSNTAVAGYTTPLGGAGVPSPSNPVATSLSASLVFRVYPNPFEPGSSVRGSLKFGGLPDGSQVHIYTLAGVTVADLADEHQHTIEWKGRNQEGSNVAAGIYLYAVECPDGKGGTVWHRGKFGVIR